MSNVLEQLQEALAEVNRLSANYKRLFSAGAAYEFDQGVFRRAEARLLDLVGHNAAALIECATLGAKLVSESYQDQTGEFIVREITIGALMDALESLGVTHE